MASNMTVESRNAPPHPKIEIWDASKEEHEKALEFAKSLGITTEIYEEIIAEVKERLGIPKLGYLKHNIDVIWNYARMRLKQPNLEGKMMRTTPIIAAAIIGNMYEESLCSEKNAEDSTYVAEDKDDSEEYIYDDNVGYATSDNIGWGLLQWTASKRKAGLLKYANTKASLEYSMYSWRGLPNNTNLTEHRNQFIENRIKYYLSDLDTQLEYLYEELIPSEEDKSIYLVGRDYQKFFRDEILPLAENVDKINDAAKLFGTLICASTSLSNEGTSKYKKSVENRQRNAKLVYVLKMLLPRGWNIQ